MNELDKRMYFNANPKTLETARLLRETMTNPEKLLWEKLKEKKLLGLRFRRQHPIDIYIVDFYCHRARLVIEVDGEIHMTQKDYDDGREAEIERYDLKVLRFSNDEVINDIEKVMDQIITEIENRI